MEKGENACYQKLMTIPVTCIFSQCFQPDFSHIDLKSWLFRKRLTFCIIRVSPYTFTVSLQLITSVNSVEKGARIDHQLFLSNIPHHSKNLRSPLKFLFLHYFPYFFLNSDHYTNSYCRRVRNNNGRYKKSMSNIRLIKDRAREFRIVSRI